MPGNGFSTKASRNNMGSNAVTDVNQGGGNKKAGFPYLIGRPAAIYRGPRGPPAALAKPLSVWNTTLVFSNISRNIGSSATGVTYWHMPFSGNSSKF
jgi:hypothetical protein